MSMSRCGYIAIAGRPNVGKSTLLNRLLGMKLSITAHKPQTTRHSVLGIKTVDDSQMIFVDTPGIHVDGKKVLNRVLNRTASSAMVGVDAIILVVQALHWSKDDERAFELATRDNIPLFIVVNKIDRVDQKDRLLPFIDQLPKSDAIKDVIPLSARTGKNVDLLEQKLSEVMPQAAHQFDADDFTDRSLRFLASEMIREQLTRLLEKELPYALSVEIEQFEVEKSLYRIGAVIWVDKSSQKGIVIGKQGAQLKEVGKRARRSMETLFGNKVYLKLWVKVKEGWADDARALHSLGYDAD